MQIMRWIGILALALVTGCGKKDTQTVTPGAQKENEVAVRVDQVGITVGQVQKEAQRLYASVAKNTPPDQAPAVQARALQQAVENLVVRQLVRAEMDRSGVLITQAELDKGKQELEKAMGTGMSLATVMAAADVSVEALEDNLRLDIFKNKVCKDQVAAAVAAVTDESVKAYYDEHTADFTQPAGRLASHILIRVPKDADETAKNDLRAKAEAVRKALLEGADFAKLASETSDCITRSRGGVMGVILRGREDKAFEDAVYSQPIGAIGEVVESPVGFHIIKVTGEQEQKQFTFDEVKDKLAAVLKARAQQKVTTDYIEGLRAKAAIRLDGPLAAAVEEAKKTAGKTPPEENPSVIPPAGTSAPVSTP